MKNNIQWVPVTREIKQDLMVKENSGQESKLNTRIFFFIYKKPVYKKLEAGAP